MNTSTGHTEHAHKQWIQITPAKTYVTKTTNCNFYQLHCAKRKAPVFKLLGRFWGFFAPQVQHVAPMGVKFDRRSLPTCQISPPSVQRLGYRTPKLKFLLTAHQNVQYKHPEGEYRLHDFHKIYRVCTPFQDPLTVKMSLDLLKGLWSYGGFKLMVSGFCQIFSIP